MSRLDKIQLVFTPLLHFNGAEKQPDLLRVLWYVLVGLAVLHIALFAIAGVLSSHVVTASPEVLLIPTDCGAPALVVSDDPNDIHGIT